MSTGSGKPRIDNLYYTIWQVQVFTSPIWSVINRWALQSPHGWSVRRAVRVPQNSGWHCHIRQRSSIAHSACERIFTTLQRRSKSPSTGRSGIFVNKISLLVQVIIKGYQLDTSITKAITQFPTPTKWSELRSFIGLVNQLSSSTNTLGSPLAAPQHQKQVFVDSWTRCSSS